MAAMIPAGVAIALPLAAGSLVLATGVGTAQLAPMSVGSAPRLHILGVNQSTIGPVSASRTLNLYADPSGSGINYTIVPAGGVPAFKDGPVQTAAVVGDSLTWISETGITAGNAVDGQATTATNIAGTGRGVMQLVAAQTGAQLRVRQFGVSGERTDQMLQRALTQLAPTNAAFWVQEGCSNDFDQFKTANWVYANVVAMWQLARCYGAKYVFINTSCGNFATQAIHDEWYKLHAMLRDLHKQGTGFNYFPPYPSIVDYSTNTNAQLSVPASLMTKDGRHYSSLGAYTTSQPLVPFFKSQFPAPLAGPGGANWVAGAGDQYSTFVANGVMGGPGVAAAGGVTGFDPTFWTSAKSGGITLAASLVARPANDAVFGTKPGQWARHTITTATSTNDTATLSSVNGNNAGKLTTLAGQTGRFAIDLDAACSVGNFTRLDIQCYVLDSSSATLVSTGMNMTVYISGTREDCGYSSLKGTFLSPIITLPAAANRARFVCTASTTVGGQAVVNWGCADFVPETVSI